MKALGRLKSNPDFALLMKTFAEERDVGFEDLLTATKPEHIHQAQGKTQFLVDLLRTVTSATHVLA